MRFFRWMRYPISPRSTKMKHFVTALLFVGCAIAQRTTPAACPTGWYQNGNMCYTTKTNTANTWSMAEADCANDGGHLASIHDNATGNYLVDFIWQHGIASAAWIGLRTDPNGNFTNWSDGSRIDYKNFGPGQDPPPVCYAISVSRSYYPGKWLSMPCDSHFRAICERPLGGYTTPRPAPTCGNSTFFGNDGNIYSPDYPNDFSAQESCNYKISVFNNYANIEVPPIMALLSWSITVYNGLDRDNTQQIFYDSSNGNQPRNYTVGLSASSPQLLVVFYSTQDNSVRPFKLHYTGTDQPVYTTVTTPRP